MNLAKVKVIMIKDKDYEPIKLMPIDLEIEMSEERYQIALEYTLKVLEDLGVILTIPESKYRKLYDLKVKQVETEEMQ